MVHHLSKKHFCILPWNHLHLGTNGDVQTCCRTFFRDPIGNLHQQEINEIWINEKFTRIREDMINDLPNPACQDCYNLENLGLESMRTSCNKVFSEDIVKVQRWEKDKSNFEFQLSFLDLRFTNICNFKCRTCDPMYSTSWLPDFKLMTNTDYPDFNLSKEKKEKLWQELIPILKHVKRIYFAGGEPLLSKDNVRLLEELIKVKNTDAVLIYNTNLSLLKTEEQNILELWKRFDKISIAASLDGTYSRGEYIRKGLNYKAFKKNVHILKLAHPKIFVNIYWTMSVLNVFHLPDAIEDLISDKILTSGDQFSLNFLNHPDFFHLGILNDSEREALKVKYQNFIQEKLPTLKILNSENIKELMLQTLSYLNMSDYQRARDEFKNYNLKLDQIRKENFLEIFPELQSIIINP